MRRLLAVTLLTALSTAGCGFALPPLGPPDRNALTVTLLVDLPERLRPVVQLAVEEFNAADLADMRGVTFRVEQLPAGPGTADARRQLRRLVDRDDVVAMVGPASLDRARALLPIANLARLPVVVPSVVEECLTIRETYCRRGLPARLRPKGSKQGLPGELTTYRVVTNRQSPPPVAAEYAYDRLNRRTAAVIEDSTQYGEAAGEQFAKRWEVKGGVVALRLRESLKDARETAGLVARVVAARADVVFVATTDAAAAGRLARALRAQSKAVVIGTDAFKEPAFLPAPDGVYAAVTPSDPAATMPAFSAGYQQRFRTPMPVYGVEVALATQVALQAVRQQIGAASAATQRLTLPDRKALQAGFSAMVYEAEESGLITFDGNGDTTNQQVTTYQRVGGRWVYRDRALLGAG